MTPRPACLFRPLENARVQCRLCRHFCRIDSGGRGKCGVRRNEGGSLQTLVGNGVAAWHVDPVEKKPFYHYLPGTRTFSFGTMGCNFDCSWCQNAELSRTPAETGAIRSMEASARDLVRAALGEGCRSLAFTYNEPTVFYELLIDTADQARQEGLDVLLVSNGYQSAECLAELRTRIQAANIDLKTFRDATLRRYCGARLQPVLDNLRTMRAMGWWLEVTTLVVPGVNDTPEELRDMARFLCGELGPETPWHLSAFHPCRNMTDRGPTDPAVILAAADIGRQEGLLFVYTGNLPPEYARPTICPNCGKPLLKRQGFRTEIAPGFQGVCPRCGTSLPGLWTTARSSSPQSFFPDGRHS